MSRGSRPLVAIPARFAESSSALRFKSEVTAHQLVSAVYAAGGEPVVIHPHAPNGSADKNEVAQRLGFADAVLLPGGGDLAAHWYGGPAHPALYDVDEAQDAFDLAVAEAAFASLTPLLAICRGLQVVNVTLGGTLTSDMESSGRFQRNHRDHRHKVGISEHGLLAEIAGQAVIASCYHHQCLAEVAPALRVTACSEDGSVEAVERADGYDGWFIGVQWHPEDTWQEDQAQSSIFRALVDAAASRVAATRRR